MRPRRSLRLAGRRLAGLAGLAGLAACPGACVGAISSIYQPCTADACATLSLSGTEDVLVRDDVDCRGHILARAVLQVPNYFTN